MVDYLINKFVKNNENIEDEHVRYAYGRLTSITGMLVNLVLFVLKLSIGLIMNSVSVMSDGFNNLSDLMTCMVTIFGYRIASKPADKEHPFGHGRVEYIVSLVIAIIILNVGFELIRQGIGQILHPSTVHIRIYMLVILLASITLKLWLGYLNTAIGKRIDNLAMIATGQDSRNDALSTMITIVAMLMAILIPDFPFDGIATIIIAGFILKSGIDLIKEIIDRLIGKRADTKLMNQIKALILEYPEIHGMHDLIIHDYGPGVKIGSGHVEVDAHMNILQIHEVIDQAERRVQDELHVMMTLHMDPIEYDNPVTQAYLEDVKNIVDTIDPRITIHDFRTVNGKEHTNIIFDMVIPYDSKLSKEEIQKCIDQHFAKYPNQIYTVITFDHDYGGS